MKCNHCWHENGVLLTSAPPQHQLICCQCNATRNMHALPEMKLRISHGDFARQFPVKYRKESFMEMETANETDDTVAALQKRSVEIAQKLNEAEQQRLMAAANEIATLARQLNVAIIGTVRLAEIAPGVMGIVADWAVRGVPSAS